MRTALILACARGYFTIAAILIEKGANIEASDDVSNRIRNDGKIFSPIIFAPLVVQGKLHSAHGSLHFRPMRY